ncbi:MAG: N-acetylmuramic acid 6-phosphate etherase [Planctomycetes bacterium]|nr:N-acetylmuramic acid 6-phosphate etherase [Planctomycetota bacterium]
MPLDRGNLTTEKRNERSQDIDCCSTREIVEIINTEDATVIDAVRSQLDHIARAVDIIVDAFKNGGRLFYVGAGTSGRLGVLDASECPPTFGSDQEMVQGIIAGGLDALVRSIEGAEDRPEDGAEILIERGVTAGDVIVGIATSGTTPYVRGALAHARKIGAGSIFLCCNPEVRGEVEADVTILPVTGPEVVTGSTRMKAGTATKLVLNMLTTTAMIKLGKVYGNLMVDLQVRNEKLQDRAERIVMAVTDVSREEATHLLECAHGHAKVAIVMRKLGLGYDEAIKRLDECGGFVRRALGG